MRIHFIPAALLLLSACASNNGVMIDEAPMSSSAAIEPPASSPAESSSSVAPISYEEAMDKTFTSERLGIEVRYPSTVLDWNCNREVHFVAEEREFSINFVQQEWYDADCRLTTDPLQNIADPSQKEEMQQYLNPVIHVQRATTDAEVRQFIDRVFSSDCIISEQNEYEGITQLFLRSKNPTDVEASLGCGESLIWNKSTGVILFSSLGSKTGGGAEWMSGRPILMPDGSIENWFDFIVMQSIRYLE